MALIINESMPKACSWYDKEGHCIRCFNYGACPYEKIDCFPKRPPRCPVIGEIPDEHGRLVDADKGLEFYADVLIKNFPATQKATIDEMILGMKKMLDALPTVLEANYGSDN